MGRREEMSPSTARDENGMVSYTKENKGKAKLREFKKKLKCFLCDGPHLVRECLERKALNALIRKRKKEEACLGSMQMLGSLQVMPKASS